jgi:hypothetical protein
VESIGINIYDISILIDAIRTHTKMCNVDASEYEFYSSSLIHLRKVIGPDDLTALPSSWIEPLVDALESQALDDYSNVVFYGRLAATLRRMMNWENS